MSWVLVKWIQEDRVSIIPCAWVVEPIPIPETGFPVEGRCYWRKKTSIFDYEAAYRDGHTCTSVDEAVKMYKSHRRVTQKV